jgi:hypothetical protein
VETRAIIDEQLRESGWECNTEPSTLKCKKKNHYLKKRKNKAIARMALQLGNGL